MPGSWTCADVAGKRIELFDPGTSPPRFVLIFLHGCDLETLVDKPAFTSVLNELRLACACPHGQHSWWADRICSVFDPRLTAEQHLLTNVVALVRERWPTCQGGVGLLGVDMGGQAALRLAFKKPQLFPAAAGIASCFDYHELFAKGLPLDEMYDSKEQCRQDTALMHIPPTGYPPHIHFCVDPDDSAWVRGNDRMHEKLAALGIPHSCDMATRAGGHSWRYFNAMAASTLKFLHAGLECESRRLL